MPGKGVSVLDMIDQQIKENWKLDTAQSHAYLTITPTVRGDERFFALHEGLEIKPYPNPLGFGGIWGGSIAKDREELEQRIKKFLEYLESWKARGLVRITITEEEKELILPPPLSDEQRKELLAKAARPRSRDHSQPQLL